VKFFTSKKASVYNIFKGFNIFRDKKVKNFTLNFEKGLDLQVASYLTL